MAQVQSFHSRKPISVAIIGGGIGGICLTIGLLRRGIPVQVYEQAADFGEIGQGMAFGPNSCCAMEMIDPAIKRAFDLLATQNASEGCEAIGRTWINFRAGTGDPKMIAKVQTFDANRTGLSSVHRARFMDELAKLVPRDVTHFGKRFIGLRSVKSGAIEIYFEDGTIATADAVLGCDGIKSTVRQVLLRRKSAEDDLSFAGTIAYRALVPMELAVELLGEDLATNSHMYSAAGGHVLTYPIDHGKTMNVVASINKDKWEHDTWVVKDAKYEDMKRDFAGWCQPVQKIIDSMKDQKPDKWGLFDSLPVPSFYRGHVALLGDAAHASLPHQGAGAGQAIEDALVLAEVLADVNTTTARDIPAALRAYDAIRRPRSQKVVSTSRLAGKVYKFQGPAGSDLDKIHDDAVTRFNWIWYEDMEVQVQRATAMLGNVRSLL